MLFIFYDRFSLLIIELLAYISKEFDKQQQMFGLFTKIRHSAILLFRSRQNPLRPQSWRLHCKRKSARRYGQLLPIVIVLSVSSDGHFSYFPEQASKKGEGQSTAKRFWQSRTVFLRRNSPCTEELAKTHASCKGIFSVVSWWVSLLVDHLVPEGTCSQVLRSTSVDS